MMDRRDWSGRVARGGLGAGGALASLALGPAVAPNPVPTLALPRGLAGGTLVAEWWDSLGGRGSDTLTIDDARGSTR